MQKLDKVVEQFLQVQGYVIVSTIDRNGFPHTACKGIVRIDKGIIYLLDLYRGRTYLNLKRNPRMSITVVDEHKFKGWCLKGRAKIISEGELDSEILKAWEEKLTSRITQRIIKNIQGQRGHLRHPEALLPKPQYLIMFELEEIVNLAPHQIG